eukprot:GHVN01001361.1.p1 GENE.GHVN01001361.1~~GHVN01001361.1.p1  ORF type:complete len:100 (-),score=3.39 GHVN01001361.1:130-429(-)
MPDLHQISDLCDYIWSYCSPNANSKYAWALRKDAPQFCQSLTNTLSPIEFSVEPSGCLAFDNVVPEELGNLLRRTQLYSTLSQNIPRFLMLSRQLKGPS